MEGIEGNQAVGDVRKPATETEPGPEVLWL